MLAIARNILILFSAGLILLLVGCGLKQKPNYSKNYSVEKYPMEL